jgi:hypothetical protein
MVRTPLVRPGEFFSERASPPAFLPPASIVVVWSLLYGLVGILFAEILWEELATDPEFADLVPNETATPPGMEFEELPGLLGEPLVWYALGLVSIVIFVLGLWLALAAVLYLVSGLFTETGRFGRLLLYTGWGFLPALLYTAFVLVELLVLIVLFGPNAYWDTLLLTDLIDPALSWLVALWVGYIWMHALEAARGLTRKQAILTTAIPIGAYFLSELWFWFL